MMFDAERIPLPPGLPTHLSVGKDGYEALCKLLDLTTRDQRQAVVKARPVKRILRDAGDAPTRQARTAERIRQSILALYSYPHVRCGIWRVFCRQASTGNEAEMPVPSLEHAALSRYEVSVLTADPDPERLADLNTFLQPGVRQ